jgi:hypothetical protein
LIVDDEFCTSRHSTSALFAAGCCCCWLLFSTGMNDLQACAFVLLFPDELWRVLTALPTVAVEGAAAAAGVPAVAFFVTIGFLGAPRFGIVVDGVVIERVYAVVNDTERLSLQLPAVEEEFAAGWCGLFFPSVLAAPTIDLFVVLSRVAAGKAAAAAAIVCLRRIFPLQDVSRVLAGAKVFPRRRGRRRSTRRTPAGAPMRKST